MPEAEKEAQYRSVLTLIHQFPAGTSVVAMCIHQDKVYVATAQHGIYRMNEKQEFERLKFEQIEKED